MGSGGMIGSATVDTIELNGERVSPGERRHLRLSLGCRPDGTPLGLPVVVVHGALPGPRVGIIAGIHGDEYEGPEGLRRFLSRINPSTMHGTIIAVLQANPLAHEVHGRTGAIDYLDLNRAFPGNPEGFLTERIASLLVQEIVERVDVLIDLHSGGLAYDLIPYVGFNSTPGAVGEASFTLAKSFGIELLYASTPFPNVLRLEAAKRNIPAILVEVGGEGRLRVDLVPVVQCGLENAAAYLGLLAGPSLSLPATYRIMKAPAQGEFLQAPTGGFLVSDVRVGDDIKEGQLLATLVDVFGSELARVESLCSGILISYRTLPVTRTGDWTYAVIPVVAEAGAGTQLADIEEHLHPAR
ncbi:MAG: succinylglutamate desuccinylase/aspartoacylase family protein [Chloroflexota bacterium]